MSIDDKIAIGFLFTLVIGFFVVVLVVVSRSKS